MSLNLYPSENGKTEVGIIFEFRKFNIIFCFTELFSNLDFFRRSVTITVKNYIN